MFYNKLLIWIKQRLYNRNTGHDISQGNYFEDRSFGEMIRDLEMDGKFGHFKNCSLFHNQDMEGNTCFVTRNFLIEAGVNLTPIFKQYLTDREQTIDGITDAIGFVRPVLFRLADELITQIRITSTDVMLLKLFVLFDNTFKFYCKDRRTREVVSKVYETKESVRAAVFEYIYCFYNVKRIQKRLGYMSPREYLKSLNAERSERSEKVA